jgi:hypothetical protein
MLSVTKIGLLAAGVVAVYMAVSALGRLRMSGPVCELPVVVEVLNGCGRPGVAERVASHLRDRGFDVMYVGNAEDFDFSETLVVDRTGDRDKAGAVAASLGHTPVVNQVTSAFFVDVTVILGDDISSSSIVVDDRANTL